MSVLRNTTKLALACLSVLATTVALAHPALLSSTPKADAEVSAPEKIELHFSENLVAQFSAANLLMTGMPGMANHQPMKIAIKVTAGGDPKTMVIVPAQPLMAGAYRVDWRAVSTDTHTVNGAVPFTVK